MSKKYKLGDIAKISSGGTPSRVNPTYWNGNIPWVKTTQIQNCIINEQDVDEWITEEGLQKSSAKMVPAGTIVLGMIGQGKTRGQVGFLNFEACTNQNAATIVCNKQCNSWFLYQYLLFNYENIRALSNSSGQGNLNLGLVEIIPVHLPPLPEQKAIADLLSTWDEAIEKTERLIQTKEKLFKQLLNDLIHKGRINHTWKDFNLGDLCNPLSRKNTENNTNVLTSSAQKGLISQLEYYNKSVSADNVTGYYLLKKGEFAYNRSSAKGYPFGATKRLDRYEKGVLSTLYLCFTLKPTAPCESDFLLHLFESGSLNRQLRAVCQEGARSHGLLNITKAAFFGIKVFLPDQNQQKKIQAALNTAQQEINLLKQIAEKYKTQKRGLMQKVLTGEWRIKPEVVKRYA
ncbi:Type I restriction modification DNA specificity domain-containing protein [Candidatus Electrothrix laxa]